MATTIKADASNLKFIIDSTARRDYEMVIFSSATSVPGEARALADTGHAVFAEASTMTDKLLEAYRIRGFSPARFAYYRDLLVNHSGARLPRSKMAHKHISDNIAVVDMSASVNFQN